MYRVTQTGLRGFFREGKVIREMDCRGHELFITDATLIDVGSPVFIGTIDYDRDSRGYQYGYVHQCQWMPSHMRLVERPQTGLRSTNRTIII